MSNDTPTLRAPTFWGRSVTATYPALDVDLDVDVAVVGAGITGVSVAWELVRTGRSVAVLDAGHVGAAVTGHSTGKVSVMQGLRYSRLEEQLGARATARYAESQLLALHHLASIVERLKIGCAMARQPAYLFAEEADDLPALTAEVKAARRAGVNLQVTLDAGLPFPVAGAAVVADQLAIDPRQYVEAVAADLVRDGGRVFECSQVVALDEGNPHRVTTRNGPVVRAHDVVVATQFPIFDRALLFPHLHPRREFVLVAQTPAWPAAPAMYSSVDRDVRSVRTLGSNGQPRLMVTGAPFAPGGHAAPGRLEELRAWADERFDHPEWIASWAAQDYDTPDGLPFIGPLHRFGKNLWAATGFGGWGLANGALASILLRDLIDGRESEYASLFHTRRLAPRVAAQSLIRGSGRLANGLVTDRIHALAHNVDSPTDLAPGSAAYIRDGGTWAAYRDQDGNSHVVSAACTHQGCLVTFNPTEVTWECPCHGSRFSVDGEVLQGPATAPLSAYDDERANDTAEPGQ